LDEARAGELESGAAGIALRGAGKEFTGRIEQWRCERRNAVDRTERAAVHRAGHGRGGAAQHLDALEGERGPDPGLQLPAVDEAYHRALRSAVAQAVDLPLAVGAQRGAQFFFSA